MRRINYSGGSLQLPDDVCHALLQYAKALAGTATADAITVTVYTETGPQLAEILIGPASQLFATPAGPDPTDDHRELVADLERRTARLLPPRAAVDSAAPWEDYDIAGEDL